MTSARKKYNQPGDRLEVVVRGKRYHLPLPDARFVRVVVDYEGEEVRDVRVVPVYLHPEAEPEEDVFDTSEWYNG